MSATSEHAIETFFRVQRRLNALELGGGVPVRTNGPLVEALEKLSCSHLVPLPLVKIDPAQVKFSVAGHPAGTFGNPDIDLILRKSTPSSFGHGDKTIMDESYRHGREILGADVKVLKDWSGRSGNFVLDIEQHVSAVMFIGRCARIKLHKLAVYTNGGHFDWHMDSTHSDQHHATVLLALNTPWVGGDFVLRRNGVETRVDMKPRVSKEDSKVVLQAVAFYTDTEHKVEPVSEGVRIVLQYDVEVTSWSKGNYREGKDIDTDSDDMDLDDSCVLDYISSLFHRRQLHQGASPTVEDLTIIKKVVVDTENLLKSRMTEVAFALQYLYRKSSILPEFLKGSDALLYQALVGSFDVSLHPVVLHESTDSEGVYLGCYAYRFDDIDPEAGEGEDESNWSAVGIMTHNMSTVFYVPNASAIREISTQEAFPRLGNEAQSGEHKYFGGGMFVRHKKSA